MKHEPIELPAAEAPARTPAPRKPRRMVALDAHVVRADGASAGVAVLDLSYEGCRISTDEALRSGEKVQLSVPRRGMIGATVRWCTKGRAGLKFDEEARDPAAKPKVARKAVRFPANSDVSLRRRGHSRTCVTVRDMSPVGCSVDMAERPWIGETLHLKFEGLETVECKVRWVEGYTAGLEFVRPVHAAVFDLLMLQLKRK